MTHEPPPFQPEGQENVLHGPEEAHYDHSQPLPPGERLDARQAVASAFPGSESTKLRKHEAFQAPIPEAKRHIQCPESRQFA
jgi:hypothetical protein